MARPKNEHPTPAELEVLKILWADGSLPVRDVMSRLNAESDQPRAYTSIMSLMNVMVDKQLLNREPHGRAYVYTAAHQPESTLGEMVSDLCQRAFSGSSSTLVTHLLEGVNPSGEELDQIRQAIEMYRKEQAAGDKP